MIYTVKLCSVKGEYHCEEQSSLGNLDVNYVLHISSGFSCVHKNTSMERSFGFFILQWENDRSIVFEKLVNTTSEVCWKQGMMGNNNNYQLSQHEWKMTGGKCLAWLILYSSASTSKTEINFFCRVQKIDSQSKPVLPAYPAKGQRILQSGIHPAYSEHVENEWIGFRSSLLLFVSFRGSLDMLELQVVKVGLGLCSCNVSIWRFQKQNNHLIKEYDLVHRFKKL